MRNADLEDMRVLDGAEAKFLPLDLKSVAADGAFEGYASLFGREDLGRDVVVRGAFADTLKERGARGVRMLFQHDPGQPIGVWDELKEDAKGLYARGRLMADVAKAREVMSLMRAGALDGLSIGFKALKAKRDARSGIRRLEKIDLWEISVVTFPMLPDARVATHKARPFAAGIPTARALERWMVEHAGLSRAEARALLHGGLKDFRARREAGLGESEAERLAQRMRDAARRLAGDL